jgi:hypothetical protein
VVKITGENFLSDYVRRSFNRSQSKRTAAKTKTKAPTPTPSYTGPLAQFASPEGFGAGSFMRARAAGFTDAQIKSEVDALRSQGMNIGQRVDIGLNPTTYGNEMAQRGAAEGGFTDAGSESRYGMRAVFLPEGSTAGGGKGVVWASGPMTDEQIYNMFAGKPREEYVLPASVNAPDQPYRAPSGTPYVDVTASPSEQARMAAGNFRLGTAPSTSSAAPTTSKQPAARTQKDSLTAQRMAARAGQIAERRGITEKAAGKVVDRRVQQRAAQIAGRRADLSKAQTQRRAQNQLFGQGKGQKQR